VLSRFVDYIAIERRFSPLTVQAYERDLREFFAFLRVDPSTFSPTDATEDDIKSWLLSMMDNHIKPRSIRRKLSSLRTYWKYCLRVGLTDKDITARIIAPKMAKPLPVFYKESEMDQALRLAESADDFLSVRNSLIIDLLYETGMRQAELLGLTPADVDLVQGQIRIFGKRRKERIVPIGDRLVQRLQTYLDGRDALVGSADLPMFISWNERHSTARPLTKSVLYQLVHNYMSEVSTLKKQSPHVLRHTFATAMLNNGADINTIKELLGHASLAATQVYTHTTFEQLAQVYAQAHPRAKKK